METRKRLAIGVVGNITTTVIGGETSRRNDCTGLADVGRPTLLRVSGRKKKIEMMKGTAVHASDQKMALQPNIDPTIPVIYH